MAFARLGSTVLANSAVQSENLKFARRHLYRVAAVGALGKQRKNSKRRLDREQKTEAIDVARLAATLGHGCNATVGGLVAKIDSRGKVGMSCAGCGLKRAVDARTVALAIVARCSRCGGKMRVG
jgi:hypothetical protein